MKTGIIALSMVALLLSGCSGTSSVAKKEKKAANFEQTAALIESGSYQFTVRSASPTGGRTIQITSLYTMKAVEDRYEAYLPYFGRAYSADYGASGGISFDGKPEELKITRNEHKHMVSVDFSITNKTERYSVSLNVGASGFGTLVINSQTRTSISYTGQTGPLTD